MSIEQEMGDPARGEAEDEYGQYEHGTTP
jgi:hypothetical protein